MRVGVLRWANPQGLDGYKDKTLLLFGDIHKTKSPCRPCHRPGCLKFPEFVKTLLREARQCIDVFIEDFPYYGKAKGAYRGYAKLKGSIGYTRYKLRKYRPTKINRKIFSWGRIHLTDLRTGGLGMEVAKVVLGSHSPSQAIRRLFRFYEGVMRGRLLKGDPAARRIVKQIKALPSSLSKSLIEAFSNPNFFPETIDTYPRVWLSNRDNDSHGANVSHGVNEWAKVRRDLKKSPSTEAWRVATGLCLSPLFDTYTLSRMFKPVFGSSGTAIVYAGDFHIAKMISFLIKKWGAKLDYIYPSLVRGTTFKEAQCLKIQGKFKDILKEILRKKDGRPCVHSRGVFGKGEISTPRHSKPKPKPKVVKTPRVGRLVWRNPYLW